MDLGRSAHRRRGDESFDYFKFRYYEKWLGGITQFFIDKGYSQRRTRRADGRARPLPEDGTYRPSTIR